MLKISQIIYGVQDLDRATREIEAHGLTVVDGGYHPGLGTANRIVPLGEAYFEILGVVDRREALRNPFGAALLRQIQHGDRLVRWSLRTEAIDEVAGKLGLTVESRSRVRPDGTVLRWRAAGLALSLVEGWLPFFMQWDDPTQYPGAIPVQHAAGARGVAWLEIAPADLVWLQRWVGLAEVPLRVVDGEAGVRRVGIETVGGELVLP